MNSSSNVHPFKEEPFQHMKIKEEVSKIKIHKNKSKNNIKILYSCIEKEIKQIKNIKDLAKVELEGKTDEVDRSYWLSVVKDEIALCKREIKYIKTTGNVDDNNSLKKIKKLKTQLQILEKDTLEKNELIANRQKLYGSLELAVDPSFDQFLEKAIHHYPILDRGCQHLQEVLKRQMRIIPGAIRASDLNQLKEFHKQLREIEEKEESNKDFVSINEIADLVQHEVDLLAKTYESKKDLLNELSKNLKDLKTAKSFAEWSTESKMDFYVKTEQVLTNPFEPPIDFLDFHAFNFNENPSKSLTALCEQIKEDQKTKPHKKKQFWDFVPAFEKKAHDLATTPELKNVLYQQKIEGLKKILSHVNQNKQDTNAETLVIGGGPGGFMRAFNLAFTGQTYRVIEKRKNVIQKRTNVITLAKDDPKDLSILLFLGFISAVDKDKKASFGHLKPHLIEIQIGDVEKYFLKILSEIDQSKHIHFETEPVSIHKDKEGNAEVTIKSKGQNEVIKPSRVLVMDGASSPTRFMLGISRVIMAKTTKIAYSTFKPTVVKSKIKGLKYRVVNFLRGSALALKTAIHAFIFNVSLEKAYGKTVERGPTAIFRIPEHKYIEGIDSPFEKDAEKSIPAHDYLISVLRETEQKMLNVYQNQIDILKFKIQKMDERSRTQELSAKQIQKMTKMKQELSELNAKFDEIKTDRAQHMHPLIDVMSSLISKNHTIQPMEVKENFLVDIMVGAAERSAVQIGKIPVILRGDASHTTDPYSGYGCKTAIEETLADQFMFSFNSPMSQVAISCNNWGHQFYRDKMINQGLRDRSLYRSGTELIARYLDRAVRDKVIHPNEQIDFKRIANKSDLHFSNNIFVSFSASEKAFMREMGSRLLEKLKEIEERKEVSSHNRDKSWEHLLTRKEKKVLNKVINHLMYSPQKIDQKSILAMESLLGKMAYEEAPEAPIISLLLKCLPFMLKKIG